MLPKTHTQINQGLCGSPLHIEEGKSTVQLETTTAMQADVHGLVHGGFVFGLADYAAMLAVNDPYVVLASAETKFLRPVRAGDVLVAEASLTHSEGKKRTVEVFVARQGEAVMKGTFTCAVLGHHVLDVSE